MHVPLTLKHFEILARLGRSVVRDNFRTLFERTNRALQHFYMFKALQSGTEFYNSEDEYIAADDEARLLINGAPVKTEASSSSTDNAQTNDVEEGSSNAGMKRKRPRRSATTTTVSYVVPDSDDDEIAEDDGAMYHEPTRKRRVASKATANAEETSLGLWIKNLSALLRVEQAKVRLLS